MVETDKKNENEVKISFLSESKYNDRGVLPFMGAGNKVVANKDIGKRVKHKHATKSLGILFLDILIAKN
jgi:hypothetical protein